MPAVAGPTRLGVRHARTPSVAVRGRGHRQQGRALVVAAVGGLVQFLYTRQGGFFLDDFRDLGQAKAGLSLHLLVSPIAGIHFQPGGRLLQWLIADPFSTSYQIAELILAVATAAGAYLLVRLLDALFGERLLHLAAGFLFASSWILTSTDQWVAGADTVPAAACALGAMLGFSRWLRGSGGAVLVGALLCSAASVLFWEQAVVLPGWLFLIWVCFLRDSPRPRRTIVAGLVAFVCVSLAFVIYVDAQPWHQALLIPPVSTWASWFATPLVRGVLPSLAAGGTSPSWTSVGVLATAIVIVVASALLAWRGRLRLSALVFLVLGVALAMVSVATGRTESGAGVAGTTPRYLVFVALVLVLALGMAPRPFSVPARGRAAIAVGTVVLLALYLVNLHRTFDGTPFNTQVGQASASYSQQLGRGIAALPPRLRTSVVDSVVPFPVSYASPDGLSELSTLMPFWSRQVKTLGEGPVITAVDPSGELRFATFAPHTPGTQVVRVRVAAAAPTTMSVLISVSAPTEPIVTRHIRVPAGRHTFTLAAWSDRVLGVRIRGVRRLSAAVGTLTLGAPVASGG